MFVSTHCLDPWFRHWFVIIASILGSIFLVICCLDCWVSIYIRSICPNKWACCSKLVLAGGFYTRIYCSSCYHKISYEIYVDMGYNYFLLKNRFTRICHALLGATGCLLFVNTRNWALGGPGIAWSSLYNKHFFVSLVCVLKPIWTEGLIE